MVQIGEVGESTGSIVQTGFAASGLTFGISLFWFFSPL